MNTLNHGHIRPGGCAVVRSVVGPSTPSWRKGYKKRTFRAGLSRLFIIPMDLPFCIATLSTMKIFAALYTFAVLAVVGVSAAFPPMPENVANGGEALRTLWTAASQGTFMNVLTHNMRSIQGPWTEFLTTEGEHIVNNYYRYVHLSTTSSDGRSLTSVACRHYFMFPERLSERSSK